MLLKDKVSAGNHEKARKKKDRNNARRNMHAQDLQQLDMGHDVLIQDIDTKRWTLRGRITDIRRNGLSYVVDAGGGTVIRSR